MVARQVVRYHSLSLDGTELDVARIGTTLAGDISLNGMFLAHADLKPGSHVHFYFELPGGYLEAVGKVVHNQRRTDAFGVTRPGAGVRFIRMSESDRVRLQSWLGGREGGQPSPKTGDAAS